MKCYALNYRSVESDGTDLDGAMQVSADGLTRLSTRRSLQHQGGRGDLGEAVEAAVFEVLDSVEGGEVCGWLYGFLGSSILLTSTI